ncbi:MAG: hypothetical protein P8M12_07585 [Flavobacteriales bacterium]|nr:hypothetical protein [Flavobacteriales bacterium]
MNNSFKIIAKATSVFSFAFIFMACQNTEVNTEQMEDIELEDQDFEAPQSDVDLSVTYQVPTPNELFTLFSDVEVAFDANLLNSTSNTEKYSSNKIKALNFGVYSTDLAFAANFGEATASLKYFSVIKNLGDELNVNNAFDQLVFDRIEQNIQANNSDSLFNLSNETYYNAYTYLKDNDRGSTLSLIVVGGWVESLYILTNLVDYEVDKELLSRIADQRLTLENLYGFMAEYQSDSDVSEIMASLLPIEEVLMNLESEESSIETGVNDNGTYNLDGGADFFMSQDEFNSLKEAVNALRNSIVESEI